EAICTQSSEPARHPGRDLVGDDFHVIGDRYKNTLFRSQQLLEIRASGGRSGMEHVPTLGPEGIVAEQLVTGRTPNVCRHLVIVSQDVLGAQSLFEQRSTAEQVRLERFGSWPWLELIEPLANAFLTSSWHGRHGVILVIKGEIIEDVLTLLI